MMRSISPARYKYPTKASAQKEVFEKIEPFLTEEEMAVYKRGRNSKSGSVERMHL